jgi:polar amino acid transport system substrate-binding protein
MGKVARLLAAIVGLWLANAQAEPLRLVYPDFPPYTTNSEAPQAVGNFLLEKIMQSMGQDYQASIVPNFKRALSEIKHNKADGFFLASQNSQRDEFAEFSSPLLYNNWSWFFRYDTFLDPYSAAFKSQAKVASIEGTNTHFWLLQNHYQVIGKQHNVKKLAQMLFDVKRIDAAFLSADVFKESAEHPNLINDEYIEVVQSARPFGIYISKQYLSQHPDFMARLNQAINTVQKQYLNNSYSLSGFKRDAAAQ